MFSNRYRFPLIIIGSFGISVSSYFLYKHFFSEKKKIVEKKEEEVYENKYYDKFDELNSDELEEQYVKDLKNNIIFENTPKGNVLMYYDFETESFIYHCDTKDISYLYLETVARKYAIQNNCKKIVVDIKRELEEAKKEKPKINEIKKDKGDKLFASFKSYNRKGSGGAKKTNKTFILRQNANRYSYKGKIKDYKYLQTDVYNEKQKNDSETLDFASFKRLQGKKKK